MKTTSQYKQTLLRMLDHKANDGEGTPLFVAKIMVKKGYLEIIPDGYRITELGKELINN